jgi:N-acetylglucosamine-6-phosphate deacetylase
MLYRAKGATGICLVTDAIAGAGLPNETHFSLFGNDCIVQGGACWLADGSALAGSSSRMIDLVRWMVRELRLPLCEVVRMATETPARAMGWEKKGALREGMDADLVVLSPELEVVGAYGGGELLG